MPKKVGKLHEHYLPVVANLTPGEVWSCDCNRLFQVTSGGPAGQERGWAPIENDPSVVDFIQEEKVPDASGEESKSDDTLSESTDSE